jgi:chromosome segregation ATPase
MEYGELEQEVDKLRQKVFELSVMMNERDKTEMKGAELIDDLAHVCDSLGNAMNGLLNQHKALDAKVQDMLATMQKIAELGSNLAAGVKYQEARLDKIEAQIKQIREEMDDGGHS